ncbi:MAG: hypothetical protein EOO47_15800 [Flavobacterium sp.]|nr:MAG: hypothetical protein EOO47_15800 [Flavobacterium sp.]
MIKSKFTYRISTPILALLSLILSLILIVQHIFNSSKQDTRLFLCLLIIPIAYASVWFFYGELRTKAIFVAIDEKVLHRQTYLGLGSAKTFDLSEFDEFIVCEIPSKFATYEYLYLMKNGRKEVKISEFYHRNYLQLKQRIAKTIKFSGGKPFSLLTDIKKTDI